MSRLLIVELKEFDATALDGTYQNLGTALANPATKVQIFNTGDTDVYLSKDSTTNWMRIPAYGALTLDESTLYFRGVDQEYYLPKGTQLSLTQVTSESTVVGSSIIAHIVTRGLFQ